MADLRDNARRRGCGVAAHRRRGARRAGRRSRPRAARPCRRSRSARSATTTAAGRASGAVECDLLVVSGGVAPATSLIAQAGGRTTYDDARGHFAIAELPDGVDAAGAVAGRAASIPSPRAQRAGARAAHALGLGDELRRRRTAHRSATRPRPCRPPSRAPSGGKCFACLCEDVTAKDIHLSVAGGLRLDRALQALHDGHHGPLPGPHVPAARGAAHGTGDRAGPPGRRHHHRAPAVVGGPARRARRPPVRARQALGDPSPATARSAPSVKWAGDWRRAYDYGDPQAEALAVHEAAGLIDVSTLGKLIVRGPEAGAFLDRLYPNRFANLKPGRIRYGVLTSDAGRIIDDGTICRLDDESFYVTTTSSGAGAVEQWFSWWLADWRMQVHLTDVTQGLAAVNLAGPRAREIMGAPHRPRLLQRGLRLPRRQARAASPACRRCSCASASSARSATRSTSRPPTASTCGTRSSRPAPSTASAPSASSPSASCACRSCTSSSARTPTRSPRPTAPRCRGSSSSTRTRTSSASGRSSTRPRSRRDGARARRLHPARRRRAHRGRRGARRPRRARRPGHERAPLAPARPRHRHGVGARRAGERRGSRSRSPTTSRTLRAEVMTQAVLRPRRRGAALVTGFEFLEPSRRRRRPQPDGGPGARRRRADGAARRLERRRRLPCAPRPTPRSPGPTSRTCASSRSPAPHELAFGTRDADRRRVVVSGHARAHAGDRRRATSTRSRSPPRSPPWPSSGRRRARCSRASAPSTCGRSRCRSAASGPDRSPAPRATSCARTTIAS